VLSAGQLNWVTCARVTSAIVRRIVRCPNREHSVARARAFGVAVPMPATQGDPTPVVPGSTKGAPRLAATPVVDQLVDRFAIEAADSDPDSDTNPEGWSVPGISQNVKRVMYTTASRKVSAVDMALQELTLDGTMNGLKTPGGNRAQHKVRCCSVFLPVSPSLLSHHQISLSPFCGATACMHLARRPRDARL
jgi:hypothetical protein